MSALEPLLLVARRLDALVDRVVFVGGAVPEPTAPGERPSRIVVIERQLEHADEALAFSDAIPVPTR